MGSRRPPGFRDLKVGDRLVLILADNTRRVAEVTNVGEGRASGRYVGPNGPEGRVFKIHSGMILCREGQAEIKCALNLVAGDLVYTPSHRSGLQYGKIVTGKNGLAVLRWDEAKQDWLKRPQEIPWDTQWFAHDSESGATDRFFDRIKEDRSAWDASGGRSGHRRIEGTNVYSWRAKERRWDLGKSDPVYFLPTTKWEIEHAQALEAELTAASAEHAEPHALTEEAPAPNQSSHGHSETPKQSVWSRLWRRLTS